MWFIYLLLGVILYSVFQKGVFKKIRNIEKWYKQNKAKFDEWSEIPEIVLAYQKLQKTIKEVGMDNKWSIWEFLVVLGLVSALGNAIREYEEKKGDDK